MKLNPGLVWIAAACISVGGCARDDDTPTDGGSSCYTAPCSSCWDDNMTFVFCEMPLQPGGTGFDYTGDGMPDNILGFNIIFREPYNTEVQNKIARGATILLAEFRRLDLDASQNDSSFDFAFYYGMEFDRPPDPANNCSGNGSFCIQHHALTAAREPKNVCRNLTLKDGAFTANAKDCSPFYLDIGQYTTKGRDVVGHRLRVKARMSKDATRLEGTVDMAIPLCSLYFLPAQGDFKNALEGAATSLVQPDLDLDGDGFVGRFESKGGKVTRCEYARGKFVNGPDCGCEGQRPFKDGFSSSFSFKARRARIRGVGPNP